MTFLNASNSLPYNTLTISVENLFGPNLDISLLSFVLKILFGLCGGGTYSSTFLLELSSALQQLLKVDFTFLNSCDSSYIISRHMHSSNVISRLNAGTKIARADENG